jgi:hypothetical protein
MYYLAFGARSEQKHCFTDIFLDPRTAELALLRCSPSMVHIAMGLFAETV